MKLQNLFNNFFYVVTFKNYATDAIRSYHREGDITPDWFLDWWKFYGIEPEQCDTYTLHRVYRESSFPSRAGHILAANREPPGLGFVDERWIDIYNVRPFTWINCLRNLQDFPTVIWFARPKMFYRQFLNHISIGDLHQDWEYLYNNEMSLSSNPYLDFNLLIPPVLKSVNHDMLGTNRFGDALDGDDVTATGTGDAAVDSDPSEFPTEAAAFSAFSRAI